MHAKFLIQRVWEHMKFTGSLWIIGLLRVCGLRAACPFPRLWWTSSSLMNFLFHSPLCYCKYSVCLSVPRMQLQADNSFLVPANDLFLLLHQTTIKEWEINSHREPYRRFPRSWLANQTHFHPTEMKRTTWIKAAKSRTSSAETRNAKNFEKWYLEATIWTLKLNEII